jgi:hypothetical protein
MAAYGMKFLKIIKISLGLEVVKENKCMIKQT